MTGRLEENEDIEFKLLNRKAASRLSCMVPNQSRNSNLKHMKYDSFDGRVNKNKKISFEKSSNTQYASGFLPELENKSSLADYSSKRAGSQLIR